MGKPLKHQRRGKGLPRYRAPSKRFKVALKYRDYDDLEKTGMLVGKVVDFVDDPARGALLMLVEYDNGERAYLIAPEGITNQDSIEQGAQAKVGLGCVVPLYKLPEGCPVFNIELHPGDGGKLVRSPGSYAIINSKENGYVTLKMPSRKIIRVSEDCRVQVGVVCGGGKKDMPLMKAGNAYYKHKARNRIWPKVRGVAMSAYNHPFGGKQHHAGRPTTVKRGDPPGRKVGHIAARTTGRKKSRKR